MKMPKTENSATTPKPIVKTSKVTSNSKNKSEVKVPVIDNKNIAQKKKTGDGLKVKSSPSNRILKKNFAKTKSLLKNKGKEGMASKFKSKPGRKSEVKVPVINKKNIGQKKKTGAGRKVKTSPSNRILKKNVAKTKSLLKKKGNESMASKFKSKSGRKPKSSIVSKKKPTPKMTDKLDVNQIIDQKFGKIMSKNNKKYISDKTGSTLADLVKFNATLANSFYKVNDQDCLEVSLLALQSPENISKLELSSKVSEAYKEVSIFRDLLLLGDLPTITQELRPYEWIYTAPNMTETAQFALMTCFVSLAMKLTGKKPGRCNMKVPGGKLSGRGRDEIVSYLAIMQTVAESMSERNNYQKSSKFTQLNRMKNDLVKIINEF